MRKYLITILLVLMSSLYLSAQHFVPNWTGNGYNHMNVYIAQATIDGISLKLGDEIGVFDGDQCVGFAKISSLTANYLEIRVSEDDPTSTEIDGFIHGNNMNLKIWDVSELKEYSNEAVEVSIISGGITFSRNSTTVLSLVVDNNYPPLAEAGNSKIVKEGDLVYLDASGSSDPDGDVLTYLWTSTGIELSSTSAINPSFTAPEVKKDSVVKFFLTVNDGEFTSAKDSVSIFIKQVNKAPVLSGLVQPLDFDEDAYIDFTLTMLDASDPDGDALSFELYGGANYNLIGNRIKSYPNYNGELIVPVRVSDGMLFSNIVNVSITVNSVNDIPVILSIPPKQVLEGYQYNYMLKARDIDAADVLVFEAITKPEWLTLTAYTDSALITGTPTTSDVGEHELSISCTDGTVTIYQNYKITVFPVGASPEVTTTSLPVAKENTAYSAVIDFIDQDSPELTVLLKTAPAWLSIEGATDGQLTVPFNNIEASITLTGTPLSEHVGTAQVVIEYTDGTYQKSKMFYVKVEYDNKPPVANDMTVELNEDKSVLITLDGYDLETPDGITFSISANPGSGKLEKSASRVYKYTPNANFFGQDQFIFKVSEIATDLYGEGTVTINVANVNDAPVLTSTSNLYYMEENTVLSLADSIEYSDALDGANADNGLNLVSVFGPFNGTFDPIAKTYTPTKNFVGNEVIFLKAFESNSNPNLSSEELRLQIKVTNVNSAPLAFGREVYVKEDMSRNFVLLAVDKEDDITDLSYEITDFPLHGEVSMINNKVSYTPELNYNDVDSFMFKVRDLDGAWSETAKVKINFIEINDRPVAKHDTVDAGGNQFVTIDFSDLVSDVETPDNELQIEFMVKNDDQSGSGVFESRITQLSGLTYTYEDLNSMNFDYIVYRVSDGVLKSQPKVIYISNLSTSKSLSTKAALYFALGDSASVDYGDSIQIFFTGLSTDFLDIGSLTIELLNENELSGRITGFGVAEQMLTVPTIVYSAWYHPPMPGTKGNDTEVVFDRVAFKSNKVSGLKAAGATDTIFIVNRGGKLAPELGTISNLSIDEDGTGTISVDFADYDTPYASLTWLLTDQESNVFASSPTTLNSTTATFTVNPEANFNGNLSLSLRVTDTDSQSAVSDFNLTVNAVNDAPVIEAISDQTVSLNTTFVLPIACTDVDNSSEELVYSATGSPSNAVASITFVNNQMNVSLVNDYRGSVNITVVASDGSLEDSESFTLTVDVENSAPQFGSISDLAIDEDLTGTIQFTPTDIDGNPVFISNVTSNNPALLPVSNVSYSAESSPSGTQKEISVNPVADKFGTAILTIYLTDGSLTTVTDVEVVVNSVNDNPVLQEFTAMQYVRGGNTSISLTATDVDSYEFTFAAEADVSGVTISVMGNQLTIGNAEDEFYGTFNLTVTVNDEDGGTDSETFEVKVLNNQALIESSTYTVDNDNKTITNVPHDETLTNFLSNLVISDGADVEVLKSDGTVADDLQTGYQAVVTAEDGVTTNTYSITKNTGILDLQDVEISFYPNPSKGNVFLNVNNLRNETIELEIVNVLGQIVLKDVLPGGEYSRTIDLSMYSKGIYLIKLSKDNAILLEKLMLE